MPWRGEWAAGAGKRRGARAASPRRTICGVATTAVTRHNVASLGSVAREDVVESVGFVVEGDQLAVRVDRLALAGAELLEVVAGLRALVRQELVGEHKRQSRGASVTGPVYGLLAAKHPQVEWGAGGALLQGPLQALIRQRVVGKRNSPEW